MINIVLSVVSLGILSYNFMCDVFIKDQQIISYCAVVSFVLIAIWRTGIAHPVYSYFTRKKIRPLNMLIVGGNDIGRMMAAKFINYDISNGMRVAGFVDENLQIGVKVFENKKVLGRIRDLSSIVDAYKIDEIVYCFGNGNYVSFQELIHICNKNNVKLRVASPLFNAVSSSPNNEKVGITLRNDIIPKQSKIFNGAKRIFDVSISIIGGIILLPLLLLIASAIKIDSHGHVLYVQTRLGKHGKPFRFYKFRSMVVNSDKDEKRKERIGKFINGNYNSGNGSMKIVDEAKITRVGKILRRFSMDELPQLYNVVKGDMSLVGPRPCLPYEWAEYDDWQKKRLSVIPGCTGLWQVTGRSSVGFNDMVILDLYYIQNASITYDIKLILQTFPVMMFGKGGE